VLNTTSRWMMWTTMALTVVVLFVGAAGFLHTRQGMRILIRLGAQCPLGKKLTAQAVESSRLRGLELEKGRRPASKRPALGLVLDSSSEFDAIEWGRSMHLECSSEVRGERFLKCTEPGTEGTTTLAFNPSGKLVAVDVFRKRVSPRSLDPLLTSISRSLESQLGKPQQRVGEMSSRYLSAGSAIRTAFFEYHFSNYVAKVTASYLPWSGLVVHEQYSSATRGG
jgi:hypothetical protein